MTPEVLEVELAFPQGADKSGPVGLVQDGDNPAAAAYELVAGDLLNREALRWRCDVDGHVVGGALGDGDCEYVCSEVRGQVLGYVAGVVGVVAGLASCDGDAWVGVPSRTV